MTKETAKSKTLAEVYLENKQGTGESVLVVGPREMDRRRKRVYRARELIALAVIIAGTEVERYPGRPSRKVWGSSHEPQKGSRFARRLQKHKDEGRRKFVIDGRIYWAESDSEAWYLHQIYKAKNPSR